jgi:hypothetical protein
MIKQFYDDECYDRHSGYVCMYATVDVGSSSHPGTVECNMNFDCPFYDKVEDEEEDDLA